MKKTLLRLIPLILFFGMLSITQAQQPQTFTLTPFTCPTPVPVVCPTVCPPVEICADTPTVPPIPPVVVVPPTPPTPPTPVPPVIPPVAGNTLFNATLEGVAQLEHITFGQPFKKGDIPAGYTLAGVQLDKKSTFSDGSLRHGIISFATNRPDHTFSVVPDSTIVVSESLVDLSNLSIKIAANNKTITIDTSNPVSQWLGGPVVNEWRFEQSIDSDLVAKVNIRKYTGSSNIRVDVVIENSYTFVGSPKNITYDTEIFINGVSKYKKLGLPHYHHAKWRKVLWSGAAPTVHVKHDIDYFLKTKAVANYNKKAVASEASLASKHTRWSNSNHEPMGISIVRPTMGVAGGRNDIGPLPGWSTTYLLSQDKRAKEIMLSIGDLSGSYPIHYKDKSTGQPVSIDTYPNVNLYWSTTNKAPDAMPVCGGVCKVPFTFDKAHQPSFVFLPYLVTGDQYYMEQMQYWANINHLAIPARFREYSKGLFHNYQIRGMAWSMRTLAQAAAFTPDSDAVIKAYFTNKLENNRANFDNLLVGDVNNKLGVIPLGYGIPYNKFRGISVWMDGFFTWSMSYMVDLDFSGFNSLFAFKAKLPISMMTDPSACWIHASLYFLNVRDLADSRAFRYFPFGQKVDYKMYDNIGRAYRESLPLSVIGKACNSQAMLDAYNPINVKSRDNFTKLGDMMGYSTSTYGQAMLLQPALAVSVDLTRDLTAWTQFEKRLIKPGTNGAAMWDILPRLVQP